MCICTGASFRGWLIYTPTEIERGLTMFNKRFAGLVLMGAALTASSAAFAAGDRDFNTAAGAVIGAAIGSQNGSGGAVVGGLVGAAVGNALPTGRHSRGYVETRVYAQPAPVYYEPAPVYYNPPPRVYYEPAPRVYYQPAPVYVEPRPVYYYGDRYYRGHGHGHHHGRW